MSGLRAALARSKTWVKADKFVAEAACVSATLCIFLYIIDFSAKPEHIIATAAIVFALLVIPRNPKVGVVIAVVFAVVSEVFLLTSPIIRLLAVTVSCLLVGYMKTSQWHSLLSPFILWGAMCASYMRANTLDTSLVAASAALVLLPWLVGRFIYRTNVHIADMHARHQLEQLRMELERKNRDNKLARLIHDSVTNDLSAILLLAEQLSGEDKEDVNEAIAVRARNALKEVHRVIDILDEVKTTHNTLDNSGTTGARLTIQGLTQLCAENDLELASLGYTGQSKVIIRTDAPVVTCPEVIKELLVELYANIVRHCKSGEDEYSLVILIEETGTRIIQTNTCRAGVQHFSDIPSGKGLDMYHSTLQSQGGKMHTNYQDDAWLVNCWLPRSSFEIL